MSAFSRFFLGEPGRAQQLPTLSPDQMQLLQSLTGGLQKPLSSALGNLESILSGKQGAFEQLERPALRQFEQQIIPKIAEVFGGEGALSSSGFQQSLSQAGANLAENLASKRMEAQSGALNQLMNLLGTAQKPRFQYQQIPGSSGALSGILGGLGSGIGTGLTAGVPAALRGLLSLLKSRKAIPNQSIQDTYMPGNAFQQSYNPYTGVMG
jgi:hypothetical protein